MKKYKIIIFGKKDCDKCKTLNNTLDTLLKTDDYKDFDKQYLDVMSKEGLSMFCGFDSLDPLGIPSLLVLKNNNNNNNKYKSIKHNKINCEICGKNLIRSHLGLQTNYSTGLNITEKMIKCVLDIARTL